MDYADFYEFSFHHWPDTLVNPDADPKDHLPFNILMAVLLIEATCLPCWMEEQ